MAAIENIKLNVFGMISSYYREFTSSVIDPTVDIYKMYENEVDDETLEDLLNTCKAHNELQNVSSLINSGEILGASAALCEIQKMISSAERVLPTELFDLLIDQVIMEKGKQKWILEELLDACIQIKTGSKTELVVHKKVLATASHEYYDYPVPLDDILISFHNSGLLESFFVSFISDVLTHFIGPVLKENKVEFKSTKTSTSMIIIKASSKKTIQEGFKDLVKISEWLKSVFNGLESFSEEQDQDPWTLFSRIYSKELFTTVVEEVSDRIPVNVLEFQEFSKDLKSAFEFEDEFKRLGFFSNNHLRDLSTNFRPLALQKRASDVLSTFRDVLSSNDSQTVLVSDSTERGILAEKKNCVPDMNKKGIEAFSNPLALEACVVSIQSQTFIEMIYQILQGIDENDPDGSVESYFLCRDVFDLFRALMPVINAEKLKENFDRALLFRNDCTYIIHHLTILGYSFQKHLPEPFKTSATFLDMIFLFHKLGDSYLDEHWKEMQIKAFEYCQLLLTDSEVYFKKLLQLLKQISNTTRSYCSENDSCVLFGKFVSNLPLSFFKDLSDTDDLERKLLKERFKSFIQDCFIIQNGYGSQKITKTLSPKDYISNWKIYS